MGSLDRYSVVVMAAVLLLDTAGLAEESDTVGPVLCTIVGQEAGTVAEQAVVAVSGKQVVVAEGSAGHKWAAMEEEGPLVLTGI